MAISNKANTALQAQYDKLRATWLSQEDATAQIKGNLQSIGAYDTLKAQNNTPVSQVAPTPQIQQQTGTSPAPITSAPIAPITPKVETPTNWQTFLSPEQIRQNAFDAANPVWTQLSDIKNESQAQVAQATEQATFRQPQVEKITTTTPQGETIVKKETPTAPIDQNARSQEILNNLNEWYKNAPNLFTDQATFKQAYWYDTADQNKKNILDAFFNSHQQNEASIYQQLRNWQEITQPWVKQTIDYKKALTRFSKFNEFKDYNANDFGTALVNWDLLPWTQVYNDLTLDPNIKAKIEKANTLNTINWNKLDTNKVMTNIETEIATSSPIAKAYQDWFISAEEANALKNTPEITAKVAERNALQSQVDELQSAYDNIAIEAKNELKGTWATTGALQALIWQRQEAMLWPLNLAIKKLNSSIWQLSEMNKESDELFKLNSDLYTADKKTAQDRAKLLEQRAYDEQVKKTDEQRAFDLKYWDINSTDPIAQRVAAERIAQQIQDQYEWLPFRRWVWEMAQDIVAELAQGKTIDQITTDIQNAVKSKEEYTNWLANNKALTTPTPVKNETQMIWNDLYENIDGTWKKVIAWEWKTSGTDMYESLWNWYMRDKVTWAIVTAEDLYKWWDTPASPTWSFQDFTYWNKAIKLDSAAAPSLQNTLPSLWNVILWETFRSKERQTQLYNAYKNWSGILAAPPGYSKHETWMAIDIYSGKGKDWKLQALTSDQVKKMNDAWWYQTAWEWDKWHFEYLGTWKGTKPVTKEATKEVTTLRKEFNMLPEVKNYKLAKENFNKMVVSAQKDSPAWDMSLIFAYMKTLDPTSTVREWEFSTAQNSWGIPDKIRNQYNQAMNWERLQPNQRADFVSTGRDLMWTYLKTYNDRVKEYQWYTTEWGNPDDIAKAENVVTPKGKIKYNNWTYIEYDWQGNYRFYNKDKKLSWWEQEWTPLKSTTPTKATNKPKTDPLWIF